MFAIVHSEDLLTRLRAGDAEAFRILVRRHDRALRHFARKFVGEEATAEEVVQETWLVVIDKLDTFEERSSLKGWIFAILANLARKRAVRDSRQTLWSELSNPGDERGMDAVRERFGDEGRWADPPRDWTLDPERRTARRQLVEIVLSQIEALPDAQATVMRMRDVEGLTTNEVSDVLEIEPGHVRVILHRARTTVREAVERILSEDP